MVSLQTGEVRDDIDFQVDLVPGTLAVEVLDSVSGDAILGSTVVARDASSGDLSGGMLTNAAGFAGRVLVDGNYQVQAEAVGYFSEVFDDVPCVNGTCDLPNGNPVAVSASSATTIEMRLAKSAAIRFVGRPVTLGAYPVEVFDQQGNLYRTQYFGFLTEPVLDNLVTGRYYLVFHTPGEDVLWPEIDCSGGCDPTLGQPIDVVSGETVTIEWLPATEIDFETQDLRAWSKVVQ